MIDDTMGDKPEKVFEIGEFEEDKEIIKFAKEKRAALLAIIGPIVPQRISPSKTIYPSLGEAEEFAIDTFVEKCKKEKIKKLYLLLHSRGGDVSSAYIIARTLQKNFNEIITVVPQLAASGATLITLISNKIIMGELSRLSPIDIQIFRDGERKSPLALLRGIEVLREEFEKVDPLDIPYPYKCLMESVDLGTWEEYRGLLSEVSTYCFRILTQVKNIDGTLLYSEEEAEEITRFLVYGFSSHEEVIDYDRAKEVGLKNIEWYENHPEVWNTMKRWLGKYILEPSVIHHIRFVIPKGGANENEEKN